MNRKNTQNITQGVKVKILFFVMMLLLCTIPTAVFAADNYNTYVPYDLTASQLADDETHPLGSVVLEFKIDELPGETGDSTLTWYVGIEKKIGARDWIEVELIPSKTFLAEYQSSTGNFQYEQLWTEDYAWDGRETISYRTYVKLDDLVGNRGGKTGYSNVASLGLMASSWAVSELQKAENYGLIPDMLKGADMMKPISREEFCELSVLLYEKASKQLAQPASPNPFVDTQNAQILKAFQLGITNGISSTSFEPKTLINREQCAAMLFRAIRAINPQGVYTADDRNSFADQKYISSWALDAARYMSSLGIIKGDSIGNFMPKAMTSVQQAAGYGMATREAAVLMAVRTYETMD